MKKSPLLFLTLALIIIGIIFISISSLSEANSTIGDKYFFLKKQSIWLAAGFFIYIVFSKINLEKIKKIIFPLYVLSIIALILVLIPGLGNEVLGARRWLNLGLFPIQPSEIVKFTSILFFPFLFSQEKNRNLKTLIIYLSIPFILIISEPNLSTSLLISGIVISIYYASGGEIKGLVKLIIVFAIISSLLVFTSPYRRARFMTLIKPNDQQSSTSYHSNQIIIALGSGGLTGKGFANSEQKNRFLPKIATDSILAIIGEETGFIGLSLVLYLYVSLITYFFKLARVIPDQFHSLMVMGIGSWIAFQSLINIAAIAAIIPLTGVPLPFISYGGSSLLTLLAAIGLTRNIEKHHPGLVYLNSEKNSPENNHHRNSYHPRPRTNKSTPKRRTI